MRKLKTNESMNDFTIAKTNDKLLDLVDESINMESIQSKLISDSTQLIFPVCGKHCYNTVFHYITAKERTSNKGDSEYIIAKSWESDGNLEKKFDRGINRLVDHRGKLQ